MLAMSRGQDRYLVIFGDISEYAASVSMATYSRLMMLHGSSYHDIRWRMCQLFRNPRNLLSSQCGSCSLCHSPVRGRKKGKRRTEERRGIGGVVGGRREGEGSGRWGRGIGGVVV